MTKEEARFGICDLVSIAEEHVNKDEFETLDNAGECAINAILAQEKIEELLPVIKKEVSRCEKKINESGYVTRSMWIERANAFRECLCMLESALGYSKIPYEVINKDTLWVAKMKGYRKVGTYDEIGSLQRF